MKPIEAKHKFIELRAEGKSYDYIAKELNISKSTCKAWETEMQTQISFLKAEQLTELYDKYYMTREARIKKIGGTLQRIEDALDGADLTELPAERLLEFKLKYQEALKDEYIEPTLSPLMKGFGEADILSAIADLLNRIRLGQVSSEQANRESTVLSNLLRAYEDTQLASKVSDLQATISKGKL